MSEEYYKGNEMYKYLKEHSYISHNKKSNYQFELSVDRAKCIANKYHNLTEELEQENKQLEEKLEKAIEKVKDISFKITTGNRWFCVVLSTTTDGKELLQILGDKENE